MADWAGVITSQLKDAASLGQGRDPNSGEAWQQRQQETSCGNTLKRGTAALKFRFLVYCANEICLLRQNEWYASFPDWTYIY